MFSSNNSQAVKTVTNGSKYRKAPTLLAGNSLIASAHSTYANPEQNIPRKISAPQSISVNEITLLKKSDEIVIGDSITSIVMNK